METLKSFFDIQSIYTLIGLGGTLFLGVIVLIIVKTIRERREDEYEGLKRVDDEKKRIEEVKNTEDDGLIRMRSKNLKMLGINEKDIKTEDTVGDTAQDEPANNKNNDWDVAVSDNDDWDIEISDNDDFDLKNDEVVDKSEG